MKTRRSGFTLIELLTVLCLVAVLLAILTPAVHRARDRARSVACQNNLKQIAIGLHNYHDAHAVFPPGWTNYDLRSGLRTRFGWQMFLTPFVDQVNIFQQADFDTQQLKPPDVFRQPIATFRCAADTTPVLNEIRANLATSNYSGNYGPRPSPRWVTGSLGEFWPGRAPTLARTDGIFWLNGRCAIRDIIDGTSSTIIVGERSATSGAAIWMGVTGNEFEDDQVTDCSPGRTINSGYSAFSSQHEGGAWFALCDGTVRFLSEQVDSARLGEERFGTFQRLSNRNDGQPVNEF